MLTIVAPKISIFTYLLCINQIGRIEQRYSSNFPLGFRNLHVIMGALVILKDRKLVNMNIFPGSQISMKKSSYNVFHFLRSISRNSSFLTIYMFSRQYSLYYDKRELFYNMPRLIHLSYDELIHGLLDSSCLFFDTIFLDL